MSAWNWFCFVVLTLWTLLLLVGMVFDVVQVAGAR